MDIRVKKGKTYLEYLKQCVKIVKSWPKWVSGERKI